MKAKNSVPNAALMLSVEPLPDTSAPGPDLVRVRHLFVLLCLFEALFQLPFERLHHVLVNHEALLVQVLNDKVVVVVVNVDDDRLDGRVALDQDAADSTNHGWCGEGDQEGDVVEVGFER